jgi:hypothetical protein
MLASVIAIAANAFGVSIEKIPLAGLAIRFDDRLFAFLLFLCLAYFLLTFALYYFIDIKNLPALPHQEQSEADYGRRENIFSLEYAEFILDKIDRDLPPNHRVSRNASGNPFTMDDFDLAYIDIYQTRGEGRKIALTGRLDRSQNRPLYDKTFAVAQSWIARYPQAAAWCYRKAWLKIWAIRSAYFLRIYLFDGALPLFLGALAIIAILGHYDLSWIKPFMPRFTPHAVFQGD